MAFATTLGLVTASGCGTSSTAPYGGEPSPPDHDAAPPIHANADAGDRDSGPSLPLADANGDDSTARDADFKDATPLGIHDASDPPQDGARGGSRDGASTADTGIPDSNLPPPTEGGSQEPTPICGGVLNTAQIASLKADPSPPPMLTGGTVVDGTYLLTSVTQYGRATPAGGAHRQTILLRGTSLQSVDEVNGSATQFSAQWTTQGGAYSMTITCPSSDGMANVSRGTFAATSTTLELIGGQVTEVLHYSKK